MGEVANLKAAGLQIFSIYESNPRKQVISQPIKERVMLCDAIALAKAVGQPEGTTIYFTVDYDAHQRVYRRF